VQEAFVEDERRQHDRHEGLSDEDDRRHKDRGALLERAHLGCQADDRGDDRGGAPPERRNPALAGRGVGHELRREGAPREREPGPDHREVRDRAAQHLCREGHERRDAERRKHGEQRETADMVRLASRRERGDAGHAGDDRKRRAELAPARLLAEHALPQR